MNTSINIKFATYFFSMRKTIKLTHGDSQYIKELSLATVDLWIKIEVPGIKSVHLRDLNTPEVL